MESFEIYAVVIEWRVPILIVITNQRRCAHTEVLMYSTHGFYDMNKLTIGNPDKKRESLRNVVNCYILFHIISKELLHLVHNNIFYISSSVASKTIHKLLTYFFYLVTIVC